MLKFKDYEIDKLIYKGKDTLVYEGYYKAKKENFIFKTLSSERLTLKNIEKLKHEYMIAQNVNSINGVTKVYNLEDWKGSPVLVREDFRGNPLKSIVKSKGINLEEFFYVAIKIVHIVNEIHKNKVIHLDISPNNILINNHRDIKIIDFGNSMLMAGESQQKKNVEQLEGTLEYISPEQTGRVDRPVDYRADYYSLGVCFYELLTGKLPFNNSDRLELIYSHIAKEPLPPIEVNNKIPKVISNIIMKLMAKMPEDRYQSLNGLKMDLKRCEKSFKSIGKVENFKIGESDVSDRFQMPEKLYGREEELKELLEFLKKAKNGHKELVFVEGNGGIGKSSLVKEMRNNLLERNLYFISGKFEQFQREIPYSAIILALENFINKLLLESSHKLTLWRERILQAVGNNGQVITDVVPALKLIIGEQNSVPKLGSAEAENRFNLVFENFIKVIAQKEHPLVMFIDDLQWADSASLNLIKNLMTNKSIEYLLIVGAYRHSKINSLEPFTMMKNELMKNNVMTNTINLKEFPKKTLESFLQDTFTSFRNNTYSVEELAEFIHYKTKGNPFFVRQFLQSLYDKEYIWFDYDKMRWCWDWVKVKKVKITQNVVELLIEKIEKLKFSTIEELKKAACIGNQFDLKTLALVNNKSVHTILEDLQPAITEGLISVINNVSIDFKENNIKFYFLHDRIQQAIYSLIPDNVKKDIHLKIGRGLLKEHSNSEETEHLFEIVRQFNEGREIIKERDECIKLTQLNFQAGMAAKDASAYKAAFIYFKTGMEMLSGDPWNEYYEVTLQLYSEMTEMAYLINDYKEMDKLVEIVLKNAKTLMDKVKIYTIKIQAYQAQLNFQEALKTGIFVLELMGMKIPNEPNQGHVDEAFAKVKEAMMGMEVEDLLKLPSMDDKEKIATMEVMSSTLPATYKTAPMLTPILACKMVEFSIKYGNSPLSAGAYTFYGLLLCNVIEDIELGYKVGEMSVNMVGNESLKPYKAIVVDMNSYCIKHWKEHLKSTLDSFMEGFRSGMENGNFECAACCLAGHAKNSFYTGRPLTLLREEIEGNIKIIEKVKECSSLYYKKIFGQLVSNMEGKAISSVKLTGEICDENRILATLCDSSDMVGMFFLFLSKTILNYHFGEYFQAVEMANKVEENIGGVVGMVDIPVFYFFDSLSRLAIHPIVSNDERENILKKVSENQSKMENWSKYAPMNFLHKFYLVEAEVLRVSGQTYEAIEYYERAISLAKEHGYINDQALGNELAANFWIHKNKYEYAKLHLKKAYFAYKLWGAEGKARDLQNKYLEIFHEKFEESIDKNETTISTLELVDINTIMKASQAISQEIVLDELIKKLIKIVIENVGAQKVIFIMKKEDNFIIKGKKEIKEEEITVAKHMVVEEYDNIPKSIINYVSRTSKSVILENSTNSTGFTSDEYIVKNKPKSVLCFPLINKRELKGIIYLENNLMTGAFTRDRLKVLEILSSQIVISLENARLYEDLERSNEILDTKVKERTTQLKQERDKLEKYLHIAEVLFLVLDVEGKIALINRKGFEVLGYSEEEVIGQKWHDKFVKDDNREEAKNSFKTLLNGESVEYSERIIINKRGEERLMSFHNTVLRDKDGNVEGTLSCGVDVTEHKLLREQLEYNKLKLEFFANLSHELKTPLNLSFSALQMLNLYRNTNLNSKDNEKLEKYTNIIKQNNYRLLKLVNNLVDITKINSNSFDLNLQNHDIVDLTRRITYSVSDYIENKNRILEFSTNLDRKVMVCDPFSIERIILNLLSNAVKFTDEGDEISVKIYDKEGSIIIVVKDTGIGIPRNKQKMIFERFRQVDKSFTRNSEGSGIGLTIVKLLTGLHDGHIRVESKVGKFTKFILELPIKELEEEYTYTDNYMTCGESLINRMDIEFSDVYGL